MKRETIHHRGHRVTATPKLLKYQTRVDGVALPGFEFSTAGAAIRWGKEAIRRIRQSGRPFDAVEYAAHLRGNIRRRQAEMN